MGSVADVSVDDGDDDEHILEDISMGTGAILDESGREGRRRRGAGGGGCCQEVGGVCAEARSTRHLPRSLRVATWRLIVLRFWHPELLVISMSPLETWPPNYTCAKLCSFRVSCEPRVITPTWATSDDIRPKWQAHQIPKLAAVVVQRYLYSVWLLFHAIVSLR